MKPNKGENPKQERKVDIAMPPAEPLWRPNWKWHAKVLAGIYVVLICVYFAVSAFLSRVPPPYRLREIPKEVTPWMK